MTDGNLSVSGNWMVIMV